MDTLVSLGWVLLSMGSIYYRKCPKIYIKCDCKCIHDTHPISEKIVLKSVSIFCTRNLIVHQLFPLSSSSFLLHSFVGLHTIFFCFAFVFFSILENDVSGAICACVSMSAYKSIIIIIK